MRDTHRVELRATHDPFLNGSFFFSLDNFRCGRPDLLSSIKKSNHTESVVKQEVDALKQEVASLKRGMVDISEDVAGLKATVGRLVQTQQAAELCAYSGFAAVAAGKRRKFHPDIPATVSSNAGVHCETTFAASVPSNPMVQPVARKNPVLSNDMIDNLTADPPVAEIELPQHIKPLPHNKNRNEPIGAATVNSQDEATFATLFSLDPLDELQVIESGAPDNHQTSMTLTPVMNYNHNGTGV